MKNPRIGAVVGAYGVNWKNPGKILMREVRRLRRVVRGRDWRPPETPEFFFDVLKVDDVLNVSGSAVSGGLERGDDSSSYRIRIDSRKSYFSRRYSIFHEFGHIMIDIACRRVNLRLSEDDVESVNKWYLEEERLCDDVANEFIYPRKFAKNEITTNRVDFQWVLNACRRYECPRRVVYRRMDEFYEEDICIQRWEFIEGIWYQSELLRKGVIRGISAVKRRRPNRDPPRIVIECLRSGELEFAETVLRYGVNGLRYRLEAAPVSGTRVPACDLIIAEDRTA